MRALAAGVLVLLGAGCGSSAYRESIRAVEENEPRNCALTTAETRMHRTCPGTPERLRLEQELEVTREALARERRERHQTLEEMNALMAPLGMEEKNRVWARMLKLREACMFAQGPDPALVCGEDIVPPRQRLEVRPSSPRIERQPARP